MARIRARTECPCAVEGQWRERGARHSASCRRARHKANDWIRIRRHHAGRANPLLRRSDRCQDHTGSRPEPGRGQVLVRVKAAGVNPLDWMVAEGKARSWLDHRLPLTLGWELAGTVEKLGADVGRFKPGDEVFGMIDLLSDGADAEFAVCEEKSLAIKPKALDFPGAAAIPIGALTAHQALFEAADLRAGPDGAYPRGGWRSRVDGGAACEGARRTW